MSLHNNQLSGTIPDFSNLDSLTELSLHTNQLSGTIPDFSNLPNLTMLHLAKNQLTGIIPDFSNLPILIELGIQTNQLSGTIPNFSKLPKLNRLFSGSNQLGGNIPNFDNLPELTHLYINDNQLIDTIPDFSNLSKLTRLRLESNQLSGSVPDFSNLPNLYELSLYSNQLSGTIPNFKYLPNLHQLHLALNQLSGSIPDFDSLPELERLYLYANQLDGPIPDFNDLSKLIYLYLHTNQLSEAIPDFNLPKLRYLDLSNNQLSDSIPNFNLPELIHLYLHINQLNGTIPDFNLPELTHLYLHINQLNGAIPDFNTLTKMTHLSLYTNQLSGSIPDFDLPELSLLHLHYNQLSESIPDFNLPKLRYLSLDRNQLSGTIPSFNATNIQHLGLTYNQLSGTVPVFDNLTILSKLYINGNHLTFNGIEQNASQYNGTLVRFGYSPQANIPTHKTNNQLYVSAGGTYENNTYKWYEVGNSTPIEGATDSIYTVSDFSKSYYCEITNSIATSLTLISEARTIGDCNATASFDIPITCEDSPTTFTNTSTYATTFQWQINGNNQSTDTDFTHTFLESGTYYITLIANDGEDCSDSQTDTITVYKNTNSITLDLGADQNLCEENTLLSANVSGMLHYDWYRDSKSIGDSLTVIADTTGNYVLQVTDYCGNIQSDTVFVLLDQNCVWPGDYNYDGTTNVYDLLSYGLHFGATGPIRSNASLNWTPQPCLDWSGETENGYNLKHIDGNGNGLIEGMDTTAILQNYGATHGVSQDATYDNSIVLELTPSSPIGYGLEDNTSIQSFEIELSEKDGGTVTAYGLAFTLEYDIDTAIVEAVYLDASNSWLGEVNTNMNVLMYHRAEDKEVDIALTRINHQNKTGSGTTIEVIFDIENFASNDTLEATFATKDIQISLSNGNLLGVNGFSQDFSLSSNDCSEEVSITYTSLDNIPTITQGSETIQIGNSDGNGTVVFPDGKRTYLQAKKSISLKAGTDIQEGSVLDASIGDCETEEDTESGKAAIGGKSNDVVFDLQIFPNPFSDRTKIDYFLPIDSPVTLTIYDIHGRVVKKLLQNKSQKAGKYGLQFTPCNMAQGIYLCKIEAGEWQKTVRLVKSN